jgi:hypothetical protein
LGAHVLANESEDPNFFVFITYGGSGAAGSARRGSVCAPNDEKFLIWGPNGTYEFKKGKELRLSINSYDHSDKELAEVE